MGDRQNGGGVGGGGGGDLSGSGLRASYWRVGHGHFLVVFTIGL